MKASDKLKEIFENPKESMSRTVKWFFGLPLAYILYILISLIVPMGDDLLVSNSLRHMLLILAILGVVKYFLGFDVKRFLTEAPSFRTKTFVGSTVLMFALGALTTFIWKLIDPADFSFAVSGVSFGELALNWFLSLILVVTAAIYEELLFRSYIAHFIHDEITTSNKKALIYCLVSAFFFTGAHFKNPEMSATALWAGLFFFIEGFAFMFFFIKSRGIEIPLGLHIGNNLVSAWLFTYDGSVIQTDALFIQHNSIGPALLIQTIICLGICLLVFNLTILKKKEF